MVLGRDIEAGEAEVQKRESHGAHKEQQMNPMSHEGQHAGAGRQL